MKKTGLRPVSINGLDLTGLRVVEGGRDEGCRGFGDTAVGRLLDEDDNDDTRTDWTDAQERFRPGSSEHTAGGP
ncbi:hypothetical protein HU200_006379 [Digitaria exilis]|uniref:Uncharacterized protein n=1 Tax=Digitaria exilis TaxID=1010633 RepID=A0A835FRR4_9POAL|nr:hypothetical protein HU200_006379 [Digitaria exilis]